jgi:hypothetical protein
MGEGGGSDTLVSGATLRHQILTQWGWGRVVRGTHGESWSRWVKGCWGHHVRCWVPYQ